MANPKKSGKLQVPKSDWQERVVAVQRVTKVVKGGKKMSFRAVVVVGNEQGKVGVGVGKATDVINAVKKAVADGKKQVITVPLTGANSIPHATTGRFGAARLILRPSAPGSGVIAGGAMRAVIESVGIHDILAKSKGSSNPHNVVKATMDALLQLRDARTVASQRGISMSKVFNAK